MGRVSQFGHYEGFADPVFDGYQRRSVYVATRDGTRLALDLFIPTRNGAPSPEPLPVVFSMTPYNRAQIIDGALVHALSDYTLGGRTFTNNLTELSRAGYVIAIADVRGQGASFGAYRGCMSAEEGRDGADLIAWIRAQDWCSGKVGMLGSSYGASTQFLVAAERPPGLAALYACHTYFEAFDVFFPGGVRQLSLPRVWGRMVDDLAGRTAASTVAPVDGDDGPALLRAAIEEHRSSPGASEIFAFIYEQGLRDGNGFFNKRTQSGSQNLALLLPELQRAAIPAYHHGGWNDYFPDQTAMWHINWKGAPSKLVIGPWTHSPRTFTSPRDQEDLRIRAIESRRWFDFWLKGIDNGVLDEAPVHYAVQHGHRFRDGGFEDDADVWHWRAANTWPPEGSSALILHLSAARSSMIDSVNDGALASEADENPTANAMIVDPDVGTGPQNRMGSSFLLQPLRFPDMTVVDRNCLTWTSPPVETPLVIAGPPRLHFLAQSSASDASFVVWLEDVDISGRGTLLTYGSLKASHRTMSPAPYETGGMLWRASTKSAIAATPPLCEGPHAIEITLLPVATLLRSGHRVRLTLAGGDQDNLECAAPGATIIIHVGGTSDAFLRLPRIEA
jgi:uncharacterized protein